MQNNENCSVAVLKSKTIPTNQIMRYFSAKRAALITFSCNVESRFSSDGSGRHVHLQRCNTLETPKVLVSASARLRSHSPCPPPALPNSPEVLSLVRLLPKVEGILITLM